MGIQGNNHFLDLLPKLLGIQCSMWLRVFDGSNPIPVPLDPTSSSAKLLPI